MVWSTYQDGHHAHMGHLCLWFIWLHWFHRGVLQDHHGPLVSCSTQLSMKFILLINIKMPTGILIFISRINIMLSSVEKENDKIFDILNFLLQDKFHSQLSCVWKKCFITSGPSWHGKPINLPQTVCSFSYSW